MKLVFELTWVLLLNEGMGERGNPSFFNREKKKQKTVLGEGFRFSCCLVIFVLYSEGARREYPEHWLQCNHANQGL